MYTDFYGGDSSSGENDTVLYLYSVPELTNQIAYNNDNNLNTEFSEIVWSMTEGTAYNIKLQHYINGLYDMDEVYTRLAVPPATSSNIINIPDNPFGKLFSKLDYNLTAGTKYENPCSFRRDRKQFNIWQEQKGEVFFETVDWDGVTLQWATHNGRHTNTYSQYVTDKLQETFDRYGPDGLNYNQVALTNEGVKACMK